MLRRSEMLTALTPLRPDVVVDVATGEVLTDWEVAVKNLVSFVTETTAVLYETHKETLFNELREFHGSANSWGRQHGYRINYEALPRTVKAKSRVQELVLHKLVAETAAYVANPTPNKQEPSFTHSINLGAVDKQMVSLSLDEQTITLLWKCWDREFLFSFTVPTYVLKYDIVRWCLPTVRMTKQGIQFGFSVVERIPSRPGGDTAGIDLGVVEPYTAVVLNGRGNRVAHYTASKQVRSLTRRKNRTLQQKRFVTAKLRRKQELGADVSALTQEKRFLAHKITRQSTAIAKHVGNELARKLDKHRLNMVNMEQLNWVSGTSRAKTGSNHSFQHKRLTTHVEHSLKRKGVRTRKVNPSNTSQTCCQCGATITHNTARRTVRCNTCQLILDRDFNAAVNIAKNRHQFPHSNRLTGRKWSANGTVYEKDTVLSGQALSGKVPYEARTLT